MNQTLLVSFISCVQKKVCRQFGIKAKRFKKDFLEANLQYPHSPPGKKPDTTPTQPITILWELNHSTIDAPDIWPLLPPGCSPRAALAWDKRVIETLSINLHLNSLVDRLLLPPVINCLCTLGWRTFSRTCAINNPVFWSKSRQPRSWSTCKSSPRQNGEEQKTVAGFDVNNTPSCPPPAHSINAPSPNVRWKAGLIWPTKGRPRLQSLQQSINRSTWLKGPLTNMQLIEATDLAPGWHV